MLMFINWLTIFGLIAKYYTRKAGANIITLYYYIWKGWRINFNYVRGAIKFHDVPTLL